MMSSYLRLLGGLSVDAPGVPASARALQRKRLALLALLAASGRRWSRDKLVAVLWPELNDERARHQLASSVYDIRNAFGEAALLSSGDELALNQDVFSVDVAEFDGAFARGDYEGATGLYAGPFLDGFFLADAPEFEQWVERERTRLSHRFADALERIAGQREVAGETAVAATAWRRAAEHDPFNTRIAIRLMRALEASGNRGAALQHAAEHRRLLQNELGVEADASLAEEETRLRTGTDTNGADNDPILPDVPAKEPAVWKRPRSRETSGWRSAALWAAVLVLVASGALYFVVRTAEPPIVIMMDSPNPARVYDEEAVRANGTNADVINDLLSDLPIKRVKETAGPYWHRHQEIHDLDPDLIVIHLSAFCAAACEPRRTRMRQFVEYLADSDAEFLIYSRFPADTLPMILRETFGDLLTGNPGLESRIHVFPVQQYGSPRWRDPATGTALKMKVKEILALP